MRAEGIAVRERTAPPRISVVRDKQVVPLLTSVGKARAEQLSQGVLFERHVVQMSEIAEHEHPDLCLHLQIAGNAAFEWWSAGRNAVEQTRPGSLILIPAGTSDRIRWAGGSERLILSIDRSGWADRDAGDGVVGGLDFRGKWAFTDAGLQLLMMEIGEQAQQDWPLGSLYADLLTVSLKAALLRSHNTGAIVRPIIKGGLGLLKLRRAMEFIHAHLMDDLRLETIARELDLSPSHFAHEFRNSTGQTPYQYLLDQRMFKATHMLRTTRLPVHSVSEMAGFRSATNFVRTFRQRTGVAPAHWRRSH